jgi:hypothetical protein
MLAMKDWNPNDPHRKVNDRIETELLIKIGLVVLPVTV